MTSMTLPSARLSHHWRQPLMAVVALILLLLLAYRDTAVAMVAIWIRAQTYNHAFVVLPIVLWLVWRKRAELAPLQPRPAPMMLVPMLGLALLWWLGHLVNVAAATQLAMTAMLIASVPLVLGWQVAHALAFPLAFTLFSVPIGDFLTPTLMHWTAEMLVLGLRLSGMPVYQEGQQLVIPSGRWAVVEACGGVRYLMATFMVGSLFAYLNYRSLKRRMIFIAASLVLPIIANWVRAYLIVMVAHYSDNKIATGDDHILYGWVFFGFVILGLFFAGARWAEADDDLVAGGTADARAAAGTAGSRGAMTAVAAAALVVMSWPVWLQAARESDVVRPPVRLMLPEALGGWQAGPLAADAWRPYFVGAASEQARVYRQAQGQVAVHVAYYRGQNDEAKLVSSINSLIAPSQNHWHVVAQGRADSVLPGGKLTWRTAMIMPTDMDLQSGSSIRPRLTVWRTYWLGERTTHSDVEAKLWQAWLAVRGEPDDGAVVHLVSSLPDESAAQQQLASFANENFNMLQQTLAQTRQNR